MVANAIPILPRTLSAASPGAFQTTRPVKDAFLPDASMVPLTRVPATRTRIDSVQNPPADTSTVNDTAAPTVTRNRRRRRSLLRTLRMVLLAAWAASLKQISEGTSLSQYTT